jgi:hypothetical protein
MAEKRGSEDVPVGSAEKKPKCGNEGYAMNVNLALDKKHESKPLRLY